MKCTNMQRSERFIEAYNRLYKYMDANYGGMTHQPYTHLLREGAKTNAVIKHYLSDLKAFGELRNAIIHEKLNEEIIIAEPHESVVKKFIHIEQVISRPPVIGRRYQQEVLSFQLNDYMPYVLEAVRDKKYSQFPIYYQRMFAGLLTESGIAQFTASQPWERVDWTETTVEEVLKLDSERYNVDFASLETDEYRAKDLFMKGKTKERASLSALLITENGQEHEKLLGIITAWEAVNLP
ncbi:hypothetical protein [Alkalicoccus halolimnae]|uniref:CBS domain-containing protein n=1 Tax=Alkalicoccus halolimnae TaxID=1667239 RepID=A0A5C7FFR6_9BACI|nr:hypothetical protein [Alkalicoccus halolimnae]TXF85059.1 hypothetical protein FTX54_09550 [Alkalicoccus halolimnae]